MHRQTDKTEYYKLLDDLAMLGRLRRLREQKRAAQEVKNQSIGSTTGKDKEREQLREE